MKPLAQCNIFFEGTLVATGVL